MYTQQLGIPELQATDPFGAAGIPQVEPFAADNADADLAAAVRNSRPCTAAVAAFDQLARPSWGMLGVVAVHGGWDNPPWSFVVAPVEGHSSRQRAVVGVFLGVQVLPGVGDS